MKRKRWLALPLFALLIALFWLGAKWTHRISSKEYTAGQSQKIHVQSIRPHLVAQTGANRDYESLAYSSDGQLIASGVSDDGEDGYHGKISLWHVRTGMLIYEVDLPA